MLLFLGEQPAAMQHANTSSATSITISGGCWRPGVSGSTQHFVIMAYSTLILLACSIVTHKLTNTSIVEDLSRQFQSPRLIAR